MDLSIKFQALLRVQAKQEPEGKKRKYDKIDDDPHPYRYNTNRLLGLLLEYDLDRNSCKIEILPQLILQETPVAFGNVLGKVTVECEIGVLRGQLGNKLDAYILSFYGRRRRMLDDGQHHVHQLARGDLL